MDHSIYSGYMLGHMVIQGDDAKSRVVTLALGTEILPKTTSSTSMFDMVMLIFPLLN